jgi:hypothetical protein
MSDRERHRAGGEHIGERGVVPDGPGERPAGRSREIHDLGDRNPSQGFSGGFWGATAYGTAGQNRYDPDSPGAPRLGRVDHTGRGPKGWTRADARIYEDVCEALTRDPDIDATDVEVRVEHGEVTLDGEVADRRMKRWAEDLAAESAGVRDVHNHLRVRRGTPSSGDAADDRRV